MKLMGNIKKSLEIEDDDIKENFDFIRKVNLINKHLNHDYLKSEVHSALKAEFPPEIYGIYRLKIGARVGSSLSLNCKFPHISIQCSFSETRRKPLRHLGGVHMLIDYLELSFNLDSILDEKDMQDIYKQASTVLSQMIWSYIKKDPDCAKYLALKEKNELENVSKQASLPACNRKTARL